MTGVAAARRAGVPRAVLVVVLGASLLAGCRPAVPPDAPTASAAPDAPAATDATGAATGGSPRGDDAPVVRRGRVVGVIDGDTFDLADGTRVRLAIVDTPEVAAGLEPCGPEATAFTTDLLTGEEVRIHRPLGAPVDDGARLLGEVVLDDGTSLNVALVAAGLGRVDERFTDEDPDLAARLRAAAADAPVPDCADGDPIGAPGVDGLVTTADGPVRIAAVVHDTAGDDVGFGTSEHVVLANDGPRDVDLAGWSVTDDDGNGVTIGRGVLVAAGRFRVHVGPGPDEPDAWHAGASQAFLNNSGGDLVALLDATGATVATARYDS